LFSNPFAGDVVATVIAVLGWPDAIALAQADVSGFALDQSGCAMVSL